MSWLLLLLMLALRLPLDGSSLRRLVTFPPFFSE